MQNNIKSLKQMLFNFIKAILNRNSISLKKKDLFFFSEIITEKSLIS